MSPRVLGKNQADHAEQSQQTWSHTEHRLGYVLPRRFKTQVGVNLLKSRFDRPTRCEPTGDLPRAKAGVGCVKVFIPVRSLHIMDKNPTHWNQSLACLIPVAGATDQLDTAITASVPAYCCRSQLTGRHYLFGRGQFAAFASWSSHPLVLPRSRGIKIGVTMEAADQGDVVTMAITKHRQFMRGIAPIAQKHESSLGKPVDQHRHQLSGQLGWGFVPARFGNIQLLGAIQGGQHWQCPPPRSKRKLY